MCIFSPKILCFLLDVSKKEICEILIQQQLFIISDSSKLENKF